MKSDDWAENFFKKFRRHRWVGILIVLGTLIGGFIGLLENTEKLSSWIITKTEKPRVVALNLSKDAIGFEESQKSLFAASLKEYRTFGPHYPFADSPAAIFLVTVSNPTSSPIIITSAIYDVAKAGGVSGGPEGPLNSLVRYNHQIEHKVGAQKRRLNPPFRIDKESALSFEIQLSSQSTEPGLGWLLRLGFETDNGASFYSEQFQLYLPSGSKDSPSSESASTQITPPPSDILRQKIDLPSGTLKYVDCIFRRVGIVKNVEGLDALDRQMIFRRAGYYSIEEFIAQRTETSPPVPYTDLFSQHQMAHLLTLVKSKAKCLD